MLTINGVLTSNYFGQYNNCGTSLGPGAFCTISAYALGYAAPPLGTLTVVDDAAAGPQTATLNFAAVTPQFPSPLNFGHVAIGGSLGDFIEIGGAGVYGSYTYSITGPNASDFSLSSTGCSYEYRFNQHCYVNVTFKPTAPGTRTAYFVIPGFPPYTLTGQGDPAGRDFDLYQNYQNSSCCTRYPVPITSLNFGSHVVGSTPPFISIPIVILNTGTALISLNAPVVSGPNASDFTVDNPSCSTGCNPTITFTPSGLGIRSATIVYMDSTGAVTRTLSVIGTGESPTSPGITAPGNRYSLVDSNFPVQVQLDPYGVLVAIPSSWCGL